MTVASPDKCRALSDRKGIRDVKNTCSKPNITVVPESMALSPRQPLNGQRVQRIPGFERRRSNISHDQEMRMGTLNVGTMTGKGREIVDMMQRRKIEALCVQETRWKGKKARELGCGYKLYYSGADETGRNGVGIILSPKLKDNIVEVVRKNDRVMTLRLIIGDTNVNIISVYAPETGCEVEYKDKFWQDLDDVWTALPESDLSIVAGDFNGHVGQANAAIERVHGGHGEGVLNDDGERLIDFVLAYDLAIVNTFSRRRTM